MPIEYIPANQRTPAEWLAIERYKAWLDDPKYLKVEQVIFNQYAVAVTQNGVELRRRDVVIEYGATIHRWTAVKTYVIKNNTIDDWDFIYHCSSPEHDQIFNDELKEACISAYRNFHGHGDKHAS